MFLVCPPGCPQWGVVSGSQRKVEKRVNQPKGGGGAQCIHWCSEKMRPCSFELYRSTEFLKLSCQLFSLIFLNVLLEHRWELLHHFLGLDVYTSLENRSAPSEADD